MPDDPVLDEPVADRRAPGPPAVPPRDAGALDVTAWERCSPPAPLRPSQAYALDRLDGASTCVVLPPGAGKTLVGLEAVRRQGRRALVLVPSTAVQAQWLQAWAAFGGTPHPLPAGTSADLRAAVTVLTYQALSAWDRSADDQDVEDSTDSALAERRRAAVRGLDGADLLSLLHPRGRELVDRASALGPWTLVVDECAHLLDTWGSLVPAVAQALGEDTVVLGLTATSAGELTDKAREVRDRLFATADVEVALPDAVVRGEVALVRDLVHLTRPTPEEDASLAGDRGRFGELRDELLRARAGSLPFPQWLERRLHDRRSDGDRATWRALQRAEPALARAGLRMVAAGLVDLPPGAVLREEHRAPADAQDWGVLLGAYADEHLRPSTSAEDARLLAAVTQVLPSLGWALTARGLRATTSPFDRVCALSASKAAGARRVLAQELAVRGPDLRALVVCGFDTRTTAGRGGAGPATGSAGAVFVELATSEAAAGLRPVLCTGRTVALRREDLADFRAGAPHRLADRLVAEPFAGQRSLVRLTAGEDWTAATWVPLVRDWLASGGTAAVVGTRGLLGEGWDSPSLNVVVDLTATGAPAVATAVRGRVLRRDPARPQEVVHAWTVTCLADEHPRGGVDHLRTVSATERQLGLTADGLVEAGVGHLDPELSPDAAPGPAAREGVNSRSLALAAEHDRTRQGWDGQGQGQVSGTARAVLRVRAGQPLGMPAGVVPPSLLQATRTLGSPTPAPLPRTPRRVRLWPLPVAAGVVTSATGTALESALVGAGGGLATGVVLGGAVAGQRWVSQSRALRTAPTDASTAVLRQLAAAVADALHAAGGAAVGAAAVRCVERRDGEVELRLDTEPEAAARFARCLEELLLPLGEPRWLVSRLVLLPPDGPASARRLAAARAVGRPVEAAVAWHAVPTWLARSRAGVDAFDTAWKAHLGAGRLVLATDPEGRSLVELLQGEDPFGLTTRVRTVWSAA